MALLRIGTRGSELALFQARTVASLLQAHGGWSTELLVIRTSGDRFADVPLSEVGGKRVFVKEIEDALLDGQIDLAVHSSKDMPAVLPDALTIGAALPREDPRDALVRPAACVAGEQPLDDLVRALGRAPRIGTSSIRRTAQLTRLFPGATFLPIRGNLDTRLAKLDAGQYDALVLAAAGLRRLGHADRITLALPTAACIPAPGQGIIAIEHRENDDPVRQALAAIDDADASTALAAERAVVRRLGGGCQMPIGAHAALDDGTLVLVGVVVAMDGSRAAHAQVQGPRMRASQLGTDLAERLLADGADEILDEVQRAQAAVQGLQP